MSGSPTFPPAIVPAPSPIPIGTSKAANRDGVTLLDLPAEIRNAIYGFALVLPDVLMVASARLFRSVDDDNGALVATRKPRKKVRPHKPPVSHLASVFFPSLRIFLTCRQVYHEATSVFFSLNTFAITRPICSPLNGGPEHDREGELFTDGADWVLSLGSQLSKLKMITLDLNALCIVHLGNLELLPLLRALWERKWTGKLEFKPARDLIVDRQRRCDGTGKAPGIGNADLAAIDQMIASLLRDDLSIREHAWALGHVAIHCRQPEGTVLFRLNREVDCKLGKTHMYDSRYSAFRSHGSCLAHRQNFRYENGKCVKIPRRSPQLMHLPTHIRQQIFYHVLCSNEPIIVELSLGKGNTLPPLLSTNHTLRIAGRKQYYKSNSISLLIKYKIGQDDVVNLDNMVGWMYPPESSHLDEDLKDIRRESVESLVLDVETLDGGPRRLEDLRINAAVLWHKRVRLGTHARRINLQVRLRLGSGDVEFATSNLDHLLVKVSRALQALYSADMGLRRSSRLEIVVDGHGVPKDYVLPATMKMQPLPPDWSLTPAEKRRLLERESMDQQ
ncbi:hypothetical protein DE146DRAFT_146748 [Phaeosphaeria sp. MPI-PUGE-AT-0046c]|nr:hypothetical protein DE146DRAFT_146748 [Phaeosphaeria sp. MPI-PUGE-AT-0046c]